MTTFKSDFLRVLSERGFIHQVSEPEPARRAGGLAVRITAYIGFDCTAAFAACRLTAADHDAALDAADRPPADRADGRRHHPGRRSLRQGRKPQDPDRRDRSTRISRGIRAIFSKFLTFGDGPADAIMANNADWLNTLNYIDFLRDVGRHFSVNRMLSFDSVKLRLERQQELSFLEFNYMILQAYDFVELHKRHGCVLQMGGSDQWGNIVNGIDLGRRMMNAQLFALTSPLITTSSGAKMGKTAAGAVWLNADMLSPYDYWQYWRNTEDGDVERFLKLFTVLPLDEIAQLAALQGPGDQRGKERCSPPRRRRWCTAARPPSRRRKPRARHSRKARWPRVCRPSRSPRRIVDNGLGVLVGGRAAPGSSPRPARRAARSRPAACKVNDETVTDEKMQLTERNLTPEGVIKLSLGTQEARPAEAGLSRASYRLAIGRSSRSRFGCDRCRRSEIRRICATGRAPPPKSD